MKIEADKATCNRARASHDLYILNMFLFNLPAVAGILAYSIGGQLLAIEMVVLALVISMSILTFIWLRARRFGDEVPWLVMVHWRLTAGRSKLLLIGYAISGAIILVGLLVSSGMADKNMQVIMVTVFTRVGIVPGLLMVLVTAILEGQAMHLANNAIVPKGLVKRFPPPPEVVVLDEMNETGE
jgi:hypothetical protein